VGNVRGCIFGFDLYDKNEPDLIIFFFKAKQNKTKQKNCSSVAVRYCWVHPRIYK